MPNLLEHYIEEIISVKPCHDEWTKEFDANFVKVVVIASCYGDKKKYERIYNKKIGKKSKHKAIFGVNA